MCIHSVLLLMCVVSSSVTNLMVFADEDTMTINITWDAPTRPAGIISIYTVFVEKEGCSTPIVMNVTTPRRRISIQFEFFTEYNITITPINGFGPGMAMMHSMFISPEGGMVEMFV